MVESVKRHWPSWLRFTKSDARTVIACLCCLMIGSGLALVIGRTMPTYWIVFGGNTDPGDGNGGGLAKQQFIDGGWIDDAHIYQVQWKADISQNTTAEANAAMPAAHDAYNRFCHANHCIVAGFSLGNDPAIQLASEVGLPSDDTYLFGAPQPSTGVFHHFDVQFPFVKPWLTAMGGLDINRTTSPGMQAFYDTKDPYANAAPQCDGPGLYVLNVQTGHYIVPANAPFHVWTGSDGVVMHEVNYAAQPGLPVSGSDPSPIWEGCPPGGWQHGGGAAGQPGLFPSASTGIPGLPAFPTAVPTAPGG